MSSELMDALRALAREKNIDELGMLDRLETNLAQTYKKILDLDNECRVLIDRETGKIHVFELVPVGGTEEEPVYEERDVTPSDVSRTAAQTAKNVILGMIRDAEREQIFDEYQDRVGDSVTGTVQQSDSRYTLIKLREGVEALLPPNEQPPTERYDHNQRIKAYIIDVRKTTKEPSIVVSRTHPGLLKRLFELEVPEIYDGIVEIKSWPASPACAPRSPFPPASLASTRSARASAPRAPACAWSSRSSVASGSTSSRGRTTPRPSWRTLCPRPRSPRSSSPTRSTPPL